jgi:hypothetical protein
VGNTVSHEVNIGGNATIYSASFNTVKNTQDYDLQPLSPLLLLVTLTLLTPAVGGKRITVRRVYYKTPHAMWRFYGYYGGLNVVGNLHQYGQFADDSSFDLIPAWHEQASSNDL